MNRTPSAAALCWLIAELIGGSAFRSDIPHHQTPWIRMGPDRERVEVAWWVYEYSFWHGASVFFSVPVFVAACLVWLCRRVHRALLGSAS